MADWSELPLISITQKAAFAPQLYIPEVLTLLQEKAKIYQYVISGEKYGMRDHVGQSFAVNIMDAIGTSLYSGGSLSAGTKIAHTNIISYTVYGTVAEYGIGVKMEKFLLNVSPSDIEGKMVRIALADTIADSLDRWSRDEVLRATTNKMNGGTYGTVGVNITFGTYANGKMTWSAIKRGQTEKLRQNIDESLPMFVHPYQWEDLVNETTANVGLVTVAQYTEKGVQKLFSGELAELNGFRIIPTNRVVGTKEAASTGTVQTADAISFRPNSAVGVFYALPPEIRYEPDLDVDYERTSGLAVYFQGCFKLLKDRECFRWHTTVRNDITASAL